MLAYHNASMGFGAMHTDDILSYDNNHGYTNYQHQYELNQLETSRTQQCLKKTTKFLLSHIGLVGLVVVYAVAGGFLFQLLEERQEKLNCQETQSEQIVEINNLKQKIVNYIQKNTTTSTDFFAVGKDNTTIAFAKIGSMLYEYREFIIGINSKYQYYVDDCGHLRQWSYANSLLFSITVITTIGYGNITPTTWEGQLCCICYATIGIPIFLLCLANISGVLGEMFRFLYAKVLCLPCLIVRHHRTLANKVKLGEDNGISTDRADSNDRTLDDGNKKNPLRKLSNRIVIDDELYEEENRKYHRVAVPLTITMLIIAAYIWIGSALFHNFEDWSMMEAGYFCFITLATIGFGDFTPGQRKGDVNSSPKLLLGAVYALFGMAILAMCFDLMQEEIVAKFYWIGTKIGIIEKYDENNNQIDQISNTNTKNKNRSSTSTSSSSINDSNIRRNTNRTIIDNENENDLSKQHHSTVKRKISPRYNPARIHPIESGGGDEATPYQRVTATKFN
ncbi:unnamed protein product [Rotaria sordida]|uniref:Potassium channel domain-containing protein n=1 Tax=Rotaria sordida TaxID=392033 RepID=A0A814G2V9_9BILA|nr:unnamed protein product [Rotaria sordida]CAF1171541.1 unnamed protein product [Rotaria sordida]CAF3825731.1 unnamed protein product [Rotaria sordida]CAF3899944.1 unnamed protein product [Rotaria sordida]